MRKVASFIEKTTGKPIKWIICFLPVLLKVYFDKKAIISLLNKENQIKILRSDSTCVVTVQGSHSIRVDCPKNSPRANYYK